MLRSAGRRGPARDGSPRRPAIVCRVPHGCGVRWETQVRSAAVPKLSLADNQIYTVTRSNPTGGAETSPLDIFSMTTVDPATGEVRSSTPMGATTAYEALQLAGNSPRTASSTRAP